MHRTLIPSIYDSHARSEQELIVDVPVQNEVKKSEQREGRFS